MWVGLLQLWDGCLRGFVLCNCNFICVILTANLSFNVAHCPVHVKTILHNRRIIAQWCIASTHGQLLGVFPIWMSWNQFLIVPFRVCRYSAGHKRK